ncbi:hypothetical protein GCM10010123_42880 [Pilimelia anulata]|uniref:DUF881 domain-containing protein n=1 Tax=Pilimelia anulata TaxID=53371 RepID=A0A8J3FCZ0_9ACTN|nr:DUF881 domain-containing protein [Pilimelia anulata]GGK08351.1 hypothetical protein GCM10010123_42880 [Pilimelia anulata]
MSPADPAAPPPPDRLPAAPPPDRPPGAADPVRPADAAADPAKPVFAPDFLTTLFRFPLDPGYADAAAARAARGPRPPGRRRLVRGTAALVACAIGVLFAVAYRKTVDDQPGRARIRTGLVGQIDTLRAKTDAMARQSTDLRARVDKLREARDSGRTTALDAAEAAAGRTRLSGAGVVISLADPQRTPGGRGDARGRVQDRDLRQVVNAVWSAGARAVQVGGVRLTATSTIRFAGPAIHVDTIPIHSPYEIRALGPANLRSAYLGTAGAQYARRLAATYGMHYTVEADEVTLAAAAEPTLRYARPLRPATSSTSPAPATPSRGASPGGR